MNASIKAGLRKLKERKGDWPTFLNQVLRGLRWHTPRSTKYSPFELAFSFQPRIHVIDEDLDEDETEEMEDLLAGKESSNDDETSFARNGTEECKSSQEAKFEEARKNINAEQQKQKDTYDEKRAHNHSFKKGDFVLLQNTRKRTRKGEELNANFTGPFIVRRVTKVNTAYLDSVAGKSLKRPVSCSRLKLFKEAAGNKEQQQPQFSRLDFRPPHTVEMKGMAVQLGLPEKVVKNRPLFGESKQFCSHSKPQESKTFKVLGDGNCLFRCFSYFVTGDEDHHAAVRHGIVDFMRKDPDLIFSTLLGDVEEYLSRGVDRPATYESNSQIHWGTDIEISAFATLCKCSVIVWKDQADSSSTECWVVYDPLQPPNSRKTGQKKNKSNGFTCLLHAPFHHFNIVLDP